jgi:hypothetical protein
MTHAALPDAAEVRPAAETWTEVTWTGVTAGLVGYALVALLVGILDVALGRSFFYTASLLGESLFYGLRDPAAVVVWPGAVFAYNGVHLVAFLAVGIAGAWLARLAERGPELWYVGFVLFLLVALQALAAVLLMTEPFRSALPLAMIVAPTVLGLVAVALTLGWERPGLRHELSTWRE